MIGELSGPGGSTNDLLMVSNGMYQISLTIASLQESQMDIYTCNSTVSPHSSLMFVTGSAEVSVSIATSILSLGKWKWHENERKTYKITILSQYQDLYRT